MARLHRLIASDTGRATLVGAYLFLAVAGAIAGKAGRDALFLSHFTPAGFAAIDGVTTLAIVAAVWTQRRLKARASTRLVLAGWLLAFAAGDVVLWAGVRTSAAPVLIATAFLWVGVQACFTAPLAAVLATRLLTACEARRRCAIVGGGGILGWMAGGWIARMMALRAGATTLLLADALLTMACALLASVSWSWSRGQAATRGDDEERARDMRGIPATVWRSPYLRTIAFLAFLSAAVTTIGGLQFRTIASQAIRDPNQLAAFFGTFNLRASVLALLFQLVVTTRVLDAVGVGALTIAPAIVGTASVGLWWSGTLTAAILLKGADHTVRYSIDRSAIDMMYRPLNEHQMLEGRTVIDAVISRWGDTAGALITLFGTSVLHLSIQSLTAISFVLLVPWLAAATVARREYRARLLDALRAASATVASRCASSARAPGGVLDPDPLVRLTALRALTRHRVPRRRSRAGRATLATAVDAEIVGFVLLAESPTADDVDDYGRAGAAAIERIARLLFLIAPDRYPACLFSAVDAEGRPDSVATEYLDATLDRPRRRLLLGAVEQWKRRSSSVGVADMSKS